MLAIAILGLPALTASGAHAADRIYWANFANDSIAFANLDGSGGERLATGAGSINSPSGVAIDRARGRIYWSNSLGNAVSFVNLDGSGGGDLNVGSATVNGPIGVAIDSAGGRIYWANASSTRISFANLDGSGGGNLNVGGATVDKPDGVVIDPVSRRIYWANRGANRISFANLDGSGGGDVRTGVATVDVPMSPAIDPIAGRIYWVNGGGGGKISFASLDGSGGEDLKLSAGATVDFPRGVVVDPLAGRIYWANNESISSANLDGSDAHDLNLGNAPVASPEIPTLLVSPRASAAPEISGVARVGSMLSCSEGTWASDLIEPFYEAPESIVFQWSRDGGDVPGATQSSLTVTAPGEYRCRAIAQNQVGTNSATSLPRSVRPAFGPATRVTLRLLGRVSAKGPVRVQVINANDFAVTGLLAAQTTKPLAAGNRRVKLRASGFRAAPSAKATVRLGLPRPLQQLLTRRHKLSLALSANVEDPAGTRRTVREAGTAKLQGHAPKNAAGQRHS